MGTFGRFVFCEVGTQPVGKTEFFDSRKSPRLHYIKRGLLLDDFHRSSFLNGILAVVLYQNFYSIIIFFAWPSVFFFQRSAKAVAFAGERSNCGFGFLLK
ncbi:hypothetical protein [Agathobaculum sp.]|jgi:hypothetical protein|uniref:hypothetical protein n=1 Tax=Agathobaculum sp. TaxID=2048138 RepID=UPI000E5276EA|nr:hypothetical protein DW923_09540 [Butyricicoccus sp. AM42-5AC]